MVQWKEMTQALDELLQLDTRVIAVKRMES